VRAKGIGQLSVLPFQPSRKCYVVTHFWVPTKQTNKKIKMRKYKKIYQKNIPKKSKNNRSGKRMLEC
jgi:hypothetical protein